MKLERVVFALRVLAEVVTLLEERFGEGDIIDVTPQEPRVSPHTKDYSKGLGLFGKHHGVYNWGKKS